MKLGIVSDTHGLVRPELLAALAGVDQILHAGDVGKPEVLEQLGQIAPVMAVRGNTDQYGSCAELPETEVGIFAGHYIYILHNLQELHLDPAAAKIAVVVSGHTHVPVFQWKRGVLYLNPGSCGPRRFNLPVSMARMEISEESVGEPEILTLL